MHNVIITGATGMIGGLVLKNCLADSSIQKVTILVRKSTGIVHPKLTEILHNDFTNFSKVTEQLKGFDICFYCIGVYTGSENREVFRTITVDYTKAFATALREANTETTFCFLSGQGADSSEKSRIMFALDKGIAENFLLSLNFKNIFIFRPGYIYPTIKRKEPNIGYDIFKFAYKYFLKFVYPNVGLTSQQLADAMVKTVLLGNEKVILENADIRKVVR